jgi:hypothetical protein
MFKNIIIKKKDGIIFSKLSGDNNPIHIEEKTGQESQFNENIVHGCLILIKILKEIKIKNYHSIRVIFNSFIRYNLQSIIKLEKKNKNFKIYKIYQNQELNINITINFKGENNDIFFGKKTYEKKYKITKVKKEKYQDVKIDTDLKLALCTLTKYVGTEYPGKFSLINEINIFKKENIYKENIINIKSHRLDRRFNIIENHMQYKKYFIDFKTSIRPTLNIKLQKPNKKIIKEIKNIKNNSLIIGGSSGIGNDLMKLFLINKKIKIIATYHKNRINIKQKNLIVLKADITNNLLSILRIMQKYKPLNIYYFATPLIDTRINSDTNYRSYYKYYVMIPLKLARYSLKYNNNFFYPSSIFLNEKKKSNYTITKKIFEQKVKILKKDTNKINVFRVPKINTKHNLNSLNEKIPNFREVLFKDKALMKSIFFYK